MIHWRLQLQSQPSKAMSLVRKTNRRWLGRQGQEERREIERAQARIYLPVKLRHCSVVVLEPCCHSSDVMRGLVHCVVGRRCLPLDGYVALVCGTPTSCNTDRKGGAGPSTNSLHGSL